MANLKKMETLVKNFSKTTDEMFEGIIENEMVDVSTLTDKEKFATLVFVEMQKALSNKDRDLVLDCNYIPSKNHNHENEEDNEYLVDYFRLVPVTNPNTTLIQIKAVGINPETGKISFKLHTSCAKANREQFEALEDDLKFKVQWNKDRTRAKTTTRMNVSYEELVDVVNSACAVLASTSEALLKAKAEKAEAKKKAEEEMPEPEETVVEE